MLRCADVPDSVSLGLTSCNAIKLYHARRSTIPFGQACEFRTGSSANVGIPKELRGQAEVIPNGLPDAQRRIFPV